MSESSKPILGRHQILERYTSRLEASLVTVQHTEQRFFWVRLAVLLAGGLSVFGAVFSGQARLGWILGFGFSAAFAIVVYFHRRVDRSLQRFRLARERAGAQIARLELDWTHIPPSAIPPTQIHDLPGHPFGSDLNLVGERSLHQLLDTSTAQGGSRRLADWLLAPQPEMARLQWRQNLLKETYRLNGFRSRLSLQAALSAGKTTQRWDGEGLVAWLESHRPGRPIRPILGGLAGLAAVNVLLFILQATGVLPPYYVFTFILYAVIYLYAYQGYRDLFSQAYHLGHHLERFSAILRYLETYPYPSGSLLKELCEPFWKDGRQPSRVIGAIKRVASAASLQNNAIVWMLLNATMPWDLYFAYRLDQAKEAARLLLPVWLDTWYELEALNSLANFAYLNPEYCLPVILPRPEHLQGPIFMAQELGHPLIHHQVRACNDFSLAGLGEVVIVSGSNMSGKSTFLRTLGINLCLAYAGAPVCARKLESIPFRLFTTINVSDSLSDGISYFYAEVRRLKKLLEAVETPGPFPVFFLIDEIFRGTNNRERHQGSRAYVQALVGKRASGVISTHDLELVHLGDEITGIRNIHFREEVIGDRMVFDFHLHQGPCPTTNALKIMALEGLPVD